MPPIAHQFRGAACLRLRDHEAGDEADGEVDGAESVRAFCLLICLLLSADLFT